MRCSFSGIVFIYPAAVERHNSSGKIHSLVAGSSSATGLFFEQVEHEQRNPHACAVAPIRLSPAPRHLRLLQDVADTLGQPPSTWDRRHTGLRLPDGDNRSEKLMAVAVYRMAALAAMLMGAAAFFWLILRGGGEAFPQQLGRTAPHPKTTLLRLVPLPSVTFLPREISPLVAGPLPSAENVFSASTRGSSRRPSISPSPASPSTFSDGRTPRHRQANGRGASAAIRPRSASYSAPTRGVVERLSMEEDTALPSMEEPFGAPEVGGSATTVVDFLWFV